MDLFCNLPGMLLLRLAPFAFLAAVVASAQSAPSGADLADLGEDVQGLSQKVDDLGLRVEQLERENGELKKAAAESDRDYATVAQLNDAIANLSRDLRAAIADSNKATLQQVGDQMEKLARQTNAALASLAHGPAAPLSTAQYNADYPKEGISYIVQKGDTLALIAKKNGAKMSDIINANKLADPSRIRIGQSLFIPGGK
jgi:nucleoid-associated protein YgaU